MGTENSRRNKINWFVAAVNQWLATNKDPDAYIDEKKLIAQFAIKSSSTEKYGVETLATLIRAGDIDPKVFSQW